jgi:preprotein translocase subunit SecF
VGTYSSIFVASPVILIWEGRFSKRTKGAGQQAAPVTR